MHLRSYDPGSRAPNEEIYLSVPGRAHRKQLLRRVAPVHADLSHGGAGGPVRKERAEHGAARHGRQVHAANLAKEVLSLLRAKQVSKL